MGSVSSQFAGIFVVSILVLSASANAKSRVCELAEFGNGYQQIMFVEDGKSRYPDLKDLYDAMNEKGSTLFEDLQRDEALPEGEHSHELSLHIPKLRPISFYMRSKPKVGKGDPACKNQKITGYECRLEQMRSDPDYGGLPQGIHTSVTLKVVKSKIGFIESLTTQLGCDKTVLPNGAPLGFDEPMKHPVRLVPSHNGKTTP